jgi:hypothetical protein
VSGQSTFTLPFGDYWFRADLDGVQLWSSDINHCTVPGCTGVAITTTLQAMWPDTGVTLARITNKGKTYASPPARFPAPTRVRPSLSDLAADLCRGDLRRATEESPRAAACRGELAPRPSRPRQSTS